MNLHGPTSFIKMNKILRLKYFGNHFRKFSYYTPHEYTSLVRQEDVRDFCVQCMEKVGTSRDHASQLAEVLVAGDYRGHYSHGLNRLEMYVLDVEKGVCDTKKSPVIEKETVSTAYVNGNNLLGPVVGKFCMDLTIEKARNTGVSWVCANNSNHYGIAGWYSLEAMNAGLLGLSFTNTSPLVNPTRARQKAVGTNPITLAAPGVKPDDHFVLDMATSAVAFGKIEMNRRRGMKIPTGWAADATGKSTTNPEIAVLEGGLLPLGGEEMTSGFKGYGLAMMVEIICGILANGAYGPNVRRWMTTDSPANLGQSFAAINPEAFAPNFKERLSEFVKLMRDLPRTDDSLPVIIPGDHEREHIKECNELGGILYPPVLLDNLDTLADRLNVPRMTRLKNL